MRFTTLAAAIFTVTLFSTGSVVAHKPSSNAVMSRRSELVNAVIDELFARGYLDEGQVQSRGYSYDSEFDARDLGDHYSPRAWRPKAKDLPWTNAIPVAQNAARTKDAYDNQSKQQPYQAQAMYTAHKQQQAQEAAQRQAESKAHMARVKEEIRRPMPKAPGAK